MFKQVLLFSMMAAFLMSACTTKKTAYYFDPNSVVPGTEVTRQGEKLALTGTALAVGQRLPDTGLVDATSLQSVNLNEYRGRVLFLSIVPSVDTKVCEAQTHFLGEQGNFLPATVKRIVISRDTPFAQQRFAGEANLLNLQYLSDYKEGAFGRTTGLLMDGPRLLARAVILVDKQGIVQYIQVVPDITHLPDMDRAFARAEALAVLP